MWRLKVSLERVPPEKTVPWFSGWSDALLMRLEPLRRPLAVWKAARATERLRPKSSPRSAEELAFLPAVLEIVETPASPLGRMTGAVIIAMVSVALAWACLGHLDIHATAPGRIIPGGKTKPVASSENATVKAIHVADGDRVGAGQVLIELDPTQAQADSVRLRRERLEMRLTAGRMQSLLDGRADIDPPAGEIVPPDLLAVHREELRHKAADHRAAILALEQERRQKEAELRGAEADVQRLEQTVPLLAEQARSKEEMAAKGWQSRTDFLRAQQDYIDRRQGLDQARQKRSQAEAAIAAAAERLRQTEAQFRAESFSQMADAEQRAASLTQEIAKAEQRDRLMTLTAPVDGVVQQLSVHAPGAVVTQGAPLLMVVPQNEGIAVEVSLQNKDAGFVLPGQAAEIKVESFPFTRYGTVPGVVRTVSGDAVQNDGDQASRRGGAGNAGGLGPDGQSAVYSVRIALDRDQIAADGRVVALTPGMAVTAEIKTGRRRVIEYVLDPVLRYRDESFRER